MSPRPYVLGRRAQQAAETRDRILDAALALFQERDITSTSMQEVARRADVAPATVLNHFGNADTLREAALERVMQRLEVPGPEILHGARADRDRLRRLVHAMSAFYVRSEEWYEIYRRERGDVPALRQAEERFWRQVRDLYEVALGPLLTDQHFARATWGLTNPATLGALREAGMTADQAADLIADTLGRVMPVRERKRR